MVKKYSFTKEELSDKEIVKVNLLKEELSRLLGVDVSSLDNGEIQEIDKVKAAMATIAKNHGISVSQIEDLLSGVRTSKKFRPRLHELFKEPRMIPTLFEELMDEIESTEIEEFAQYKGFKLVSKDEDGKFEWDIVSTRNSPNKSLLGGIGYFLFTHGLYKPQYKAATHIGYAFLTYFKKPVNEDLTRQFRISEIKKELYGDFFHFVKEFSRKFAEKHHM